MSSRVVPDELPPMNLEAELSAIGCMFLNVEAAHEVVPLLKPEDFYRDSHQVIFRLAREFYDRGDPLDSVIFAEELKRKGLFEKAGGHETLQGAIENTPSAANGRYYAQIVKQRALVRNLIEIGHQIILDGQSNTFTADELLTKTDVAVARLAADALSEANVTAFDAVASSMKAFEDRKNGVRSGIPSGLAELDDILGGLRPQRLIVIAARPSIGKSSLITSILYNVALAGHPVLLFSFEMDQCEIGDRLICGHARLDGYLYTNPYRMIDAQHDAVEEAAAFVERLPIQIDEESCRTIRQIVARCRRAVLRDGVKLIAIDYLQLLESEDSRSRESRSEFVARCARRLKILARELKVPILLVSQLNREAEKRDKKRPMLADLRESGAIEQDADAVVLLHRPDFYDPFDQPGMTELIIAKNRGGRTGTPKVSFLKAQTRFVDYQEPGNNFEPIDAAEPFG